MVHTGYLHVDVEGHVVKPVLTHHQSLCLGLGRTVLSEGVRRQILDLDKSKESLNIIKCLQ